jgi:hypothetical protein
MPATPKVGRATSINNRAAERVKAMTMTGGESTATQSTDAGQPGTGHFRQAERSSESLTSKAIGQSPQAA